MKWETGFSRLNLIIGLIFPIGKKGQSGKKILFYVLQIYDFPLFLLQLSTNTSYEPLRHQLVCSSIWLPESNKSDRNQTGDSMRRLASLNSIPPTWRSFVLFYSNYSVRSKQQNLPLFHFWVVAIYGHRASHDSLTMLISLRFSYFW